MQPYNSTCSPPRSVQDLYSEMLAAQAREHPEETRQSREIFVCSWLLKHAFEYLPENYMDSIGDRQLWGEDIVGGAVLIMHQHLLEVREQSKSAQQPQPSIVEYKSAVKVHSNWIEQTIDPALVRVDRYATPLSDGADFVHSSASTRRALPLPNRTPLPSI